MRVHVVVFDPQGSMGGFDWFYTQEEAARGFLGHCIDGVPLLGVLGVEVADGDMAETTDVLDEQLPEFERRLGYVQEPTEGAAWR